MVRKSAFREDLPVMIFAMAALILAVAAALYLNGRFGEAVPGGARTLRRLGRGIG